MPVTPAANAPMSASSTAGTTRMSTSWQIPAALACDSGGNEAIERRSWTPLSP